MPTRVEEVNLKNAAFAFMQALRTPEIREKWEIAKSDSRALRTLIMETVGMAQLPTEQDLASMRDCANDAFDSEIRFLVFGEKPPHAVGNGFMVQQDMPHAVGAGFAVQE